jgi:hypothetical protein
MVVYSCLGQGPTVDWQLSCAGMRIDQLLPNGIQDDDSAAGRRELIEQPLRRGEDPIDHVHGKRATGMLRIRKYRGVFGRHELAAEDEKPSSTKDQQGHGEQARVQKREARAKRQLHA